MLEVVGQQNSAKLYVSLELSAKTWIVGLSDGRKERTVSIPARDLGELERQIGAFRAKRGLPEGVRIRAVYEAGPDGFSVARALRQRGITCDVIDSSSIEKSRRRRQAKTDNLDAKAMLRLLYRYDQGDRYALRVVHEPSVEKEDLREVTRERKRIADNLKAELASIGSLLKKHGLFLSTGEVQKLDEESLNGLTTLDGRPLGPHLKSRLLRSLAVCTLLRKQRRELEAQQRSMVKERTPSTAREDDGKQTSVEKVERLMTLKGIGQQGAWLLVNEFFGWRTFANRKEVGAAAGLTPTPYASGSLVREQGISKAGNKRVRTLVVELAWLWLRHQPNSKLSRWYQERWQSGGRFKRVGIVAVARRLLIDLWRFVEQGVVPEGAALKPCALKP